MIDPITLLRAQEAGLPAAEAYPDPPLVAFPMASEWRALNGHQIERQTWPMPDTVATAVDAAGQKRAGISLLKLVQGFGWRVRVTYAVGCWPSVGGKPSRQRASYAYRFWRGRQRAVAVYVEPPSETGKTWSWDTLMTWDLESFPRGHGGIEDFAVAMTGPIHGPEKP